MPKTSNSNNKTTNRKTSIKKKSHYQDADKKEFKNVYHFETSLRVYKVYNVIGEKSRYKNYNVYRGEG